MTSSSISYFEDLYTKYNVSFLFVLPLFKDIINNIKDKSNRKYNIHGLFCDCGLLNTYLLNSTGEFNNIFTLVFDQKTLLNVTLTDKMNVKVYNLLDLLTNYKYFHNIKNIDDKIFIELVIDKKWNEDIKLIMSSSYSKVSSTYKKEIVNDGRYILSEKENITYLYIENIPAQIMHKTEVARDIIKRLFNIQKIEMEEYFNSFSHKKETYSLNKTTCHY